MADLLIVSPSYLHSTVDCAKIERWSCAWTMQAFVTVKPVDRLVMHEMVSKLYNDINNRALGQLLVNDLGSRMVLKCLCGCQLDTDG